ncbi:MAG: saccharopine dehydrogenase NADP-binding domain-containing protein [Elusimicrobia bacterium]|nr:saccharopine dehydrogenase NADP-binding domain-containing protein [Elusimicrobiota bacterium]
MKKPASSIQHPASCVVIGCGRQGAAMVYDLIRYGSDRFNAVVLADRDPVQIKRLVDRVKKALRVTQTKLPKIVVKKVDASQASALRPLIKGAGLVMSSSHYALNPIIAKAAVEEGVHYADLGGELQSSIKIEKLGKAAAAKRIFLASDLGLAPGISSILVGWGVRHLQAGYSATVYCGGLPERPVGPLGYKIVFSVEGLWGTHLGKTAILRDGRIVEIETLSEVENVNFGSLGSLEGFITSGALATAPWTLCRQIRSYVYKTLRYPGYVEKLKFLRDMGLLSSEPVKINGTSVLPRQLTGHLFNEKLSGFAVGDLVALRAVLKGKLKEEELDPALRWDDEKSGAQEVVFEALERSDSKLGFSAMERTTGFGAAAAAIQLLDQKASGFVLLERDIDAEAYIKELQKRNIVITRSQKSCLQPRPETVNLKP